MEVQCKTEKLGDGAEAALCLRCTSNYTLRGVFWVLKHPEIFLKYHLNFNFHSLPDRYITTFSVTRGIPYIYIHMHLRLDLALCPWSHRGFTALIQTPSWIWGGRKKSKGEGKLEQKEKEGERAEERENPRQNKFLVTALWCMYKIHCQQRLRWDNLNLVTSTLSCLIYFTALCHFSPTYVKHPIEFYENWERPAASFASSLRECYRWASA